VAGTANVVVVQGIGPTVNGNIKATGNITSPNLIANTGAFYGSGAGLTSIPGANVTGTVANATYSTTAGTATSATTAGTVTTAAQPNITSVGTLNGLTVTGTATADTVSGTTGSFTNATVVGLAATTLQCSGNAVFASTQQTRDIIEQVSVNASAPTSTTNINLYGSATNYYTVAATANWTFNFRGNSSVTTNSYLSTGQSVTTTILVTQGSSAYYPTAFTIDGTSVAPKWLGGAAPAAGDPNSIDAYTFTIVKTASATYTVFASVAKYA